MMSLNMFWQLLRPQQRRAAVALFALMLLAMVLETFGIALVMPALSLMTTPNLAETYPSLAPLLGALGYPTQAQLVSGGMMVFVAIIGVKVAVVAFMVWRQSRFAFGVQADLAERLFAGYVRQPWTFHLQRNSAQLIRNATREVALTTDVSLSILALLTECLVVAGVSLLLLAVEPVGALVVVATLGSAAWIFHRVTRTRLSRWGTARQHHEGLRIQHLQQGLGGAKDVKLLGREDAFIEQFRRHNDATAQVAERVATLGQLPRLWFELLAAIGLTALVLTMIAQGKPMEALLPSLGVFAVAAFRLMPSLGRIMGSLQSTRYSMPAIDIVHAELALLEESSASATAPVLALEREMIIENLAFHYPQAPSPALSEVSLRIERGSSVGIIGGSGAGKSTLVDVMLGLLKPTSGCVRVDGVDIAGNLRSWQDQVGYVPQSVYLTDDTLRRNIAFGIPDEAIDEAAVRRALAAAKLDAFVASLPQGLDAIVGERGVKLSGGQRQRIGIARALYHDPAVLVLDEATSSLDGDTERGVMDAIDALHGAKTIVIVAHRYSTVERCDHVFRLEDGRLVQEGTFDAVVRFPQAVAK
jgi:ATP-binding cassette, subfamily B, bacterial PglK